MLYEKTISSEQNSKNLGYKTNGSKNSRFISLTEV